MFMNTLRKNQSPSLTENLGWTKIYLVTAKFIIPFWKNIMKGLQTSGILASVSAGILGLAKANETLAFWKLIK